MESSLNALIFEVSGTCGPRQKSMNCGPERVLGKDRIRFSAISSHFIQSSAYFRSPSSLGVSLRSYGRSCAWISHIFSSIFRGLRE